MRYLRLVDPDDLRAFIDRPWEELRAAKRAFAAERARLDPTAARRISRGLAERMRKVRGRAPTHQERLDDFEAHVRVKALFDQAAHAFAGR